jgi:hypothetical protein
MKLTKKFWKWLEDDAGLIFGQFEVSAEIDTETNSATFGLTLKGTPSSFSEETTFQVASTDDGNANVSLSVTDDNREVRVFFEVVEEGFIHCVTYPSIHVDSARYGSACEVANNINCRSRLAFIQLFPHENEIVIRAKASSCAQGTKHEFDSVAYVALRTCYDYWNVFDMLATTTLSADEVLNHAGLTMN